MKEKIHIRQAELQDLDAIERIELENFSEEEAIAREILKDHIEKIQTFCMHCDINTGFLRIIFR